jgi:hypothetical protein
VVETREVLRGCCAGVQDRGDQSIHVLWILQPIQRVLHDANRDALLAAASGSDARVDLAEEGAVLQALVARQDRRLGGEPCRLPERADERPDLDASHARRLRERRDARDGLPEDRVPQLCERGSDPDERLLRVRVGLEELSDLRLGSDREAAYAVTSESYWRSRRSPFRARIRVTSWVTSRHPW